MLSHEAAILASDVIHMFDNLMERIERAPKGQKKIIAKIVDNKLSFDFYIKHEEK